MALRLEPLIVCNNEICYASSGTGLTYHEFLSVMCGWVGSLPRQHPDNNWEQDPICGGWGAGITVYEYCLLLVGMIPVKTSSFIRYDCVYDYD